MSRDNVRNLVSVRIIDAVEPIGGADNIESVKVGGWTVVVKKGEFKAGDECVYFEIDSALPLDRPEFEFLRPRGVKEIDGREYHVLKTVRLKGVYSQGLVLPAGSLYDVATLSLESHYEVIKYEPPVPANMKGQIVGKYPTHLGMKTDSERAQNLSEHWGEIYQQSWKASEKVDGQSVSFWFDPDDSQGAVHVASRNWEVVELPSFNAWLYKNATYEERHGELVGVLVQGEFFGEGVQGNPLGIKGNAYQVFSVWRNGLLLDHRNWPAWCLRHSVHWLDLIFPATAELAIEQVDGLKSTITPQKQAEGVVWHQIAGPYLPFLNGRRNFKCINNKYLLKRG